MASKSDRCGPASRSSGPKTFPHCWSNLPLDIMQLVFERLGFADFKRAKSVCSSWRSASKQCKPNNKVPWMILFPNDKNHGLLFNPEEKDKVYKTQDLGYDFAKSFCVVTYRNWLLMQNRLDDDNFEHDFYILDLLTRERMNLPILISEFGLTAPVFWIDAVTKDYLVIGAPGDNNPISFKKGDILWRQLPQFSKKEEYIDLLYKDHKLYLLNFDKLKIFDFSGEIPVKVLSSSVWGCICPLPLPLGRIPHDYSWPRMNNNVVVTLSGHILIVRSDCPGDSEIWNFQIFKMASSKEKGWEEIFSLGDEAIYLDLGITLHAKDIEGIKRNSIYFNGTDIGDQYNISDSFIFNLDTKMIEQPHNFVCSSVPCSNARWFLPCFKRE